MLPLLYFVALSCVLKWAEVSLSKLIISASSVFVFQWGARALFHVEHSRHVWWTFLLLHNPSYVLMSYINSLIHISRHIFPLYMIREIKKLFRYGRGDLRISKEVFLVETSYLRQLYHWKMSKRMKIAILISLNNGDVAIMKEIWEFSRAKRKSFQL